MFLSMSLFLEQWVWDFRYVKQTISSCDLGYMFESVLSVLKKQDICVHIYFYSIYNILVNEKILLTEGSGWM